MVCQQRAGAGRTVRGGIRKHKEGEQRVDGSPPLRLNARKTPGARSSQRRWSEGQKRRWDEEVRAKAGIEERVKRAVAEPKQARPEGTRAVSKKTAEAIKAMGINHHVCDPVPAGTPFPVPEPGF
jgi:hypothetical protein